MQWMIYGATGYTGQLVAEEAVRRGHRPIIAGRNVDKLRSMSQRLGLEYAAFTLDDVGIIGEAIADMDVIYHAAGPHVYTSAPMLRACLATKTHYLDISGEITVFEQTYQYDEAARRNGIALISGVGFDVVPTDCLASYVARKVPGAVRLEIGLLAFGGATAGTTKTSLDIIAAGGFARRDGRLVPVPLGHKTRKIRLKRDRSYQALAVPWGDLSAVYRSTGVPNITTYMALSPALITLAKLTAPLGIRLFRSRLIRRMLGSVIDRFVDGPDEHTRATLKSYMWTQASSDGGQSVEAWLQTAEPYQFTIKAGVLAVERTLELQPIGALSPVQAFGEDFVLDVEGTQRLDVL